MNSSYITSAQRAEQLPEFERPEVAFIGRSNVGKSSLLNALLERRALARTSQTPGRTQMVNFFSIKKGEKEMILADLPGYGFSAIGQSARRHWQGLVNAYLARPRIYKFLFLIDVRRAHPLIEEDRLLLADLARRNAETGVTIVLTKADKVSRSEQARTIAGLRRELEAAGIVVGPIIAVSTLKKSGIKELQADVLMPLA